MILLWIPVLLLVYAILIEPRWLRIRSFDIHLSKSLPRPITILHLSDIHFCGRQLYKERWFKRLQKMNPDFIFVTGDIIDTNAGIDQAARLLSSLKAKHGTFAILGNHDYFDYHILDNIKYHTMGITFPQNHNDIPRFVEALKKVGITVLINQSASLQLDNLSVTIGGTDDPVTQKVDFEASLNKARPEALNILLTHFLDSILHLDPKRADVVFAGHTHGGQVRLPIYGPVVVETKMNKPYDEGVRIWKGLPVCISRGMSASRTQLFRFLCPPEALQITLKGPAN